jgi:hypothetical protein
MPETNTMPNAVSGMAAKDLPAHLVAAVSTLLCFVVMQTTTLVINR